jgi:tetratricopeptide (TPR) repeat protein
MKNLILTILVFLGAVSVSAQATPNSAALDEAVKLGGEVVKLFSQSKFDDALPLAQRVIVIREKEQGKNHLAVGQAWRNLAYIQVQRGKTKEAEKAFSNAFEIYEKNQPLAINDEKVFADLLETVAIYEANDRDIIGAQKKFIRAVELREKINGKESPETAGALLKLGQVYQLEGDYEKSAPVLLRSLDISTKKTGKLEGQSEETYRIAYCALSKLDKVEEKTQLQERFYPKTNANDQTKPLSGGVLNGKALNLAKPTYPYEARKKRASGAVSVQVLIDEEGKIIFACAVSGAKELQRTSEIAAYQSKFSPTTLNGKPVRVSGIVTYNYVP